MAFGEKRDDGTTKTLLLLMGGCAVASVLIGLYYWRADSSAPLTSSSSGFDIASVDARPPSVSAQRPRPSGPKTSPLPVFGSLAEDLQAGPSAPASTGAGAAAAAPAAGAKYDRQNEQKFLAEHRRELQNYQRKLDAITGRYYKNYPVVRDVDRQFAEMPRYMAVKQRYDQDGNPFSFARDSIALPEVRGAIAQRLGDAQAWQAALGMINEAMKDPPPPAVYGAAQQFMTGDPAVVEYMTGFTGDVKQNIPVMLTAIQPGTDLSSLQKVARDVAPGAMAPSPAAAAH